MDSRISPILIPLLLASLCCFLIRSAEAQETWLHEPINYRTAAADNPISRLQTKLEKGSETLQIQGEFGYLESLLKTLNVPVDSQTLVFSKTSLQLRKISPATPRALYFNDELYIGYTVGGDVLEISVADPRLGTAFYTLSQTSSTPQFRRQSDECIACHSSSRTEGVPGHLMRSLKTAADGQPLFSAGSQNVNHTTPLQKRFGGWYVTGTHGSQRHQGNVFSTRDQPDDDSSDSGLNRESLQHLFRTDRYLSPHSDLVALMILGHQVLVHNRLTKAAFTTREALNYQQALNKALKNPPGTQLESTSRRIASAGEQLVEALLMAQEAQLTESVSGTAGFQHSYSNRGPRDSHDRSLFQLDLQRRLFRFPCSPLIYSPAFRSLPAEMKTWVVRRIRDVLKNSATDARERFTHLSAEDRENILEILSETHPDFRDATTGLPDTADSRNTDAANPDAGTDQRN